MNTTAESEPATSLKRRDPVSIETTYLGLSLRTPLVVSASPMTGNMDGLRRIENAGASAAVLPSIFEEQLRGQYNDPSWFMRHGVEPYPPALSYLPSKEDFQTSPGDYLELVSMASKALCIPVIASISGYTRGNWTHFAEQIQEAGASALELSVYHVPTDFAMTGQDVENSYLELIADIRQRIKIPLAVKLSPFFTSFPNMAERTVKAGADGLVLFNRLFNADIELDHFDFNHKVRLTTSKDIELPLRWISLLSKRLRVSLAATSGVHTGQDALKLLAAGADVTMVCSALLRHGFEYLKKIEAEVREWLESRGHPSLAQIRGVMSYDRWADQSTLERGNYIWAVGNISREGQGNKPV